MSLVREGDKTLVVHIEPATVTRLRQRLTLRMLTGESSAIDAFVAKVLTLIDDGVPEYRFAFKKDTE